MSLASSAFDTTMGGVFRAVAGTAYHGARGAAAVAPHAAIMGGSAALAVGAAGMRAATGLGYGGYRAAKFAGNVLSNGRGAPLTWHSHEFLGAKFKLPTFNRALQNTLAFGALGAAALSGAVGGGMDQVTGGMGSSGGWRIAEQAANGMLEIERPGFMGATGSLTLEMHRQRRGGSRTQQDQRQGGMSPGMRGAAMYADDVLRLARF